MKPLPCPPHRWSDFSRLLDLALALPEPERGPWLAALSGPDAELQPHLAQVLASADANADADAAFLSAPRLPPGNPADGLQPGQRVGPYELVNELGRGGMGVVWLARRADGAYARDVALKLPHAHLLVGGVRERFLQERDILASLSHPHIARFYDAGLADDGQPYLALELVHGRPITQWAREQRLGLPARIALLGQVMAAVEHAHGKLVAHRDLKPANVLVGADGQARLLDFGIAKLLHFNEAEAANEPLTRSGQRPATPGYAAPEQLTGGTITVATDIFALGAMLFELLTGRMPTRSEPAGTAHAALLADPPLPSASIDEAQAQAVGLGPRALRHALAGDLDAIVAKAMSTDPRERYSAVADFAADLARHQRGEPILARRITAAQRGLKFVRRHRAAVTLSTLLGVSLIVGVTGVVWQAQRAQAQARRAEAVKDFLLGVFKASDPRIASDTPRGQITAKALLDASAGQIESRFADDPQVQIELLRTAADIYRELGEDNAYESLEARQIALARKHYGALHPNVLNGMVEAAVRASSRGDNATCRRLLDESDRPITQAGLDTDELRATWWSQRSICLRDLPEKEAERDAALQRSLDLYARHAPKTRGHVTALAELATEQSHRRQLAESVATNRRAIALAEQLPDRNDAELITIYSNLALALQQDGDLAGAEAAFARSAQIAERTSGAASRMAWQPAAKRARTAHLAGDRVRAQGLFEAVLAALPPDSGNDFEALNVREDYGTCLASEGHPQAALPLLEKAETGYQNIKNHEFALRRLRRSLGDAYDRLGRSADARRAFTRALADYEAHTPAASQPLIAMRERWARFLLDQGDVAGAQAQFNQALRDAGTPTWSHVALAQAGQARVALAQGDLPSARAASERALQTWSKLTGFKDMRMQPYLWRVRAAVLARDGDAAGARALREQALTASQRYDAPESPTVRDPLYIGL